MPEKTTYEFLHDIRLDDNGFESQRLRAALLRSRLQLFEEWQGLCGQHGWHCCQDWNEQEDLYASRPCAHGQRTACQRDGRAYVYKALKAEPAKAVVTQPETCGEDFEKLWTIYAKGARKKAEAIWMSMDGEAKGMALAHAAMFVRSRDWKYLPDLHNYLKNQQYLEKTEDRLVIDAKSEYMPYVGDSIKYNLGRFLYSGAVYEGMTVYDGYNDDARPVGAELFSDDGASVVWDGKEWRTKNGLR